MSKRVLNVGQCSFDHAAISRMITHNFDAQVLQADSAKDTISALKRDKVDLVLVNRKLDADYSDGLDIIKQIKADPELAGTPCMLVTNYQDQQQLAVEAGAVPGFGKMQYGEPETLQRLKQVLED